MVRRIIAFGLAALHASNGVFMLTDPRGWLSFVVGRPIEQTPAGVHFMFDVGWAFVASAIGFLVFAMKPRQWGAAVAGCSFPLLHALMHTGDMLQGHSSRPGFELAAIVIPALLGVIVAWPDVRGSKARADAGR